LVIEMYDICLSVLYWSNIVESIIYGNEVISNNF
jgi:hypothetical protein